MESTRRYVSAQRPRGPLRVTFGSRSISAHAGTDVFHLDANLLAVVIGVARNHPFDAVPSGAHRHLGLLPAQFRISLAAIVAGLQIALDVVELATDVLST